MKYSDLWTPTPQQILPSPASHIQALLDPSQSLFSGQLYVPENSTGEEERVGTYFPGPLYH